MKHKERFYVCPICGNIIEKVFDSGYVPSCCGMEMKPLEAGVTDGKLESHVPVCTIENQKAHVKVGEKMHPSTDDHYIEWIEIVTNKGIHRRFFKPGETPEWKIRLCDDEKICDIYAYCNLHLLWRNCFHEKPGKE